MPEVSDRVQRAWCDWDHPDKDGIEIPDPHTECKHGVFALWKRRNAPLQDWLAFLAFVADRAGDKYWWDLHISGVDDEFDFYIHGGIDEGFTGEQKGLFEFSPRRGQELREAVILAIDAILDHAQEGYK